MTPISRWYSGFPKMCEVFADGVSHGSAKVTHREISKEQALRSSLDVLKHGRGSLRPGDVHAQLHVHNTLWMSDTHDEQRDHMGALWNAKGDVLIGGLGLGMVALGVALKAGVDSVTVLDINPDVIGLVEPHLKQALAKSDANPDILKVIQADVFEWKPPQGQKYDMIWWDIWPHLCTENLAEHATLNRRFARSKAPGAWTGCWGHEILLRQRRVERREAETYRAFARLWRR